MKLILATVGVFAGLASAAVADPITKYTITGRSAAAATAQGVPLDQTPRAPAPTEQAAAGTPGAEPTGAAESGAATQPAPRVVRYGLLGLSWRTE